MNAHTNTLTAGQIYDVTSLQLIGWTGNDVAGYNVHDYFDARGRYKGPDCNGVEPMFAKNADERYFYVVGVWGPADENGTQACKSVIATGVEAATPEEAIAKAGAADVPNVSTMLDYWIDAYGATSDL